MKRALRVLFIVGLVLSSGISMAQKPMDLDELLQTREQSFAVVRRSISQIKNDSTALAQFIKKCELSEYPEGQVSALNSLAIKFRNSSQYDQAIAYHTQALRLADQCQEINFKATSFNMLGVVYRRMDQVREAIEYHQQAMALIESENSKTEDLQRSLAVSHNSLGNIYLTLREDELAEAQFLEALEIEKEVDNKLGLAINYHNLGGIYEERGELNTAVEFFEKSLDYNNLINSDYGRVICKNSIGHIYLLQEKYQEAFELVAPTVQIAEDNGDYFYIVETYTNMGWTQMGLGKLNEAETWLNKALEVAKEKNFQFYIAENYKLLATLSEKRGQYKNAYTYSQLFYDNEQKYLNKDNQDYVANLIMRYDSEKKKNRIELLEKENELVNLKLTENRIIFSAIAVALGLISVLLYFLYRQNKLKTEKELIHMEQTMLRSQMNPHFIFNSLNSIKLYIISNEKDKAVYYLNKFSKLIRTILNNSQESNITLKEELDTMELYMNIENIRFSNIINFNIEIDKFVNPNQIKIPSMILQPFLENSIWHGLSSITGEKRIDLKAYRYDEDFVHIEIRDNGIGRKRSKEIKASKTLKRKSIGIKLTEQRLQNFYKKSDIDQFVEMIDHVDSQGAAMGTSVIIKIPCAQVTELNENLVFES